METKKERAPKFVNYIRKEVGRVIFKQQLISENDRVLIALSGGKDSLVLLETLADRKRYIPFNFELFATHVIATNVGYEINIEYLKSFCKELGVPFHILEIAPEGVESGEKSPCFICSWTRRKAIFDLTKTLNINKLAFGHHMDDALETLLMNMVYHGSMSSMPYSLKMFDGRVEVIRPLLEFSNKQMIEYAQLRQFPSELKRCPHDGSTKRTDARKILQQIDVLHKTGKKNMFRAMGNPFPEYLPEFKK